MCVFQLTRFAWQVCVWCFGGLLCLGRRRSVDARTDAPLLLNNLIFGFDARWVFEKRVRRSAMVPVGQSAGL